MSIILRGTTLPAVLALALLPAIGVLAQKVTVGTQAGDNAFPFGSDGPGNLPYYAAGGEYQEIYSSANFSNPVNINSVAFASSSRSQAGLATYDVVIGLSNTNATAGTFSNASPQFSVNEGPNFTTVFTGTLKANLQANNTFDLVFPTKPFFYDPSKGNLLFDVVVTNPVVSQNFSLFDISDQVRVFQSFGQGAKGTGFVDNEGLYTQFGVSPAESTVPEPSTTAIFGVGALGLIVLGIAARRKKRTLPTA